MNTTRNGSHYPQLTRGQKRRFKKRSRVAASMMLGNWPSGQYAPAPIAWHETHIERASGSGAVFAPELLALVAAAISPGLSRQVRRGI